LVLAVGLVALGDGLLRAKTDRAVALNLIRLKFGRGAQN
jgi:hypothetical protein